MLKSSPFRLDCRVLSAETDSIAHMKQVGAAVLVCLLPLRLLAEPVGRPQSFTDELRDRLEILESVLFTLVDHNPLVMSVETLAGRSGPFVITADRQFVQSLSEEEL